jgi:hypothetical protein
MNRRQRTRVPFQTSIRFFSAGEEIICSHSKDLSLNGVYLFTASPPAVGTRGEVEIVLALGPDPLRLPVTGEVIRRDPEGLALKFLELDPAVFAHLKKIVDYNSGRPEAIDAELIRQAFDHTGQPRGD